MLVPTRIVIALLAVFGAGLGVGVVGIRSQTISQRNTLSVEISPTPSVLGLETSAMSPPPAGSPSTQITPSTSYQFSGLKAKCQQGVNNYEQLLKTSSEDLSNLTASTDRSVKEWEDWESDGLAKINKHWETNKSGLSSEDSSVVQAVQRLAENITEQKKEIEEKSRTSRLKILEDAKKQTQSLGKAAQTMTSRLARLKSCIASVSSKQSFSPTELAEINSLIDLSNSRPIE